MKSIFAMFLFAFAINAHASQIEKLNCGSSGGGYLSQKVRATQIDSDSIAFEFERFSPVPDIVPDAGIKIEGDIAKRVQVRFPLKDCLIKHTAVSSIHLIACTTGISKIRADLELLDGSTKQLVLRDNIRVEAYQVDTDSVYESRRRKVLTVSLNLDHSANGNQLGFHLRECK